jgi:benzoyl-CoA reductase/2-hydroxyglutaryl-CoA dehydratase subunit BcrC/BadD/HgdB
MREFKIINKDRDVQYKNMMEAIGRNASKPVVENIPLKSTRMRSIINSHRLAGAYKSNSKVAYIGEQFPTEIIFAFDYIAWNIESMGILFSQSGDVNEFFNLTQENSISRDICSFLRGPFGLMLANCYPTPDIIVANDQPCDCLGKLKFMASKFYETPFYKLNTPNNINDDSISYLVNQFKRLLGQIESTSGIDFEEDNFRSVVMYSNKARDYYCKIVQLHRKYNLPGISRELHEIFGMNCFGLKETVQLCKSLYSEALEMSNNPDYSKKEKRVLWVGQIPEDSHELLQLLEKEVEIIYWAPLWEANLMMLDDDEPLKSIARRAILYHWHLERMREDTIDICEKFEIEGIVLANMWGCRNMMGISPMMREMAATKDIKCLTINIDIIDRNNYSFTNVKNRIDAFLEILL